MRKDSRVRHFFLVLYCSPVELDRVLLKYSCRIHHAVSIVHDKCIYQEDLLDNDGNYVHRKGDLEKVHRHLLITFYNAHTFSAVKKMFMTENDSPRVEPVNDMLRCFEYLTHKNDPDKYQYLETDLCFHVDKPFYDDLVRNGDRRDTDNIASAIVNDMLCGTSPRILIARYGRDYVIHMRQYKEVVDEIRAWDVSHPTKELGDKWEKEFEQMGLFD